jgi:DNA replication protein DnaC
VDEIGDILKKLDKDKTKGTKSENQPSEHEIVKVDCDSCSDLGWFTEEVAIDHPDFGRYVICDCQQNELKQKDNSQLIRYSNLGHLVKFNFESFNPEFSSVLDTQSLIKSAKDLALEYTISPKGWLVLLGPHGSGKTHLSAAIANQCIQNGQVAIYIDVPDLMDNLRSTFAPDAGYSYSEIFDRVRNTPLLILDDLGSAHTTPWSLEKLQQILNHRFNAELPTVIAISQELSSLDPYIRSRIKAKPLSKIIRLKPSDIGFGLGTIPKDLQDRMTLDSFSTTEVGLNTKEKASLKLALEVSRTYASYPDGWLTFSGSTGVGKTHLAVAIGSQRIKEGDDVFFAFVPDLLDYLRSSYTPNSAISYDEIFERIRNAGVLILDDLGQERGGPWAEEKLYQLLVHRHNLKLPTIITTLDDFDGELGPIRSRAADKAVGYVLTIIAKDFRRRDN